MCDNLIHHPLHTFLNLPHLTKDTSPAPLDLLPSPSIPAPPSNTHQMITRAKNNITKPHVFIARSTRYPIPCALLVAVDLTITKPTCYTQAAADINWHHAMNTEFDACWLTILGDWFLCLKLKI